MEKFESLINETQTQIENAEELFNRTYVAQQVSPITLFCLQYFTKVVRCMVWPYMVRCMVWPYMVRCGMTLYGKMYGMTLYGKMWYDLIW